MRWSVKKSVVDNKTETNSITTYEPNSGFTIKKDNSIIAKFDNWLSFYRTIDVNNMPVKNVPDPTEDQDAVNKRYVENTLLYLRPKRDLFEIPLMEVTDKNEFEKVALLPKTAYNAEISSYNPVNRTITLDPGVYKIIVILGRSDVASSTIKLSIGNQILRQVDLVRYTSVDFTSVIDLRSNTDITLQAKKSSSENAKFKGSLLIEIIF